MWSPRSVTVLTGCETLVVTRAAIVLASASIPVSRLHTVGASMFLIDHSISAFEDSPSSAAQVPRTSGSVAYCSSSVERARRLYSSVDSLSISVIRV